ncbi:MAG: hypothetical protein RL001_161, partial [Pseudomonadota bacterium]
MTTNVPAAPGAVIDIKLSEQAMPHAGSLFTQTLGASLDRLFVQPVQTVKAASNTGTLTAGSGFNVNIGNDASIRVNGARDESPDLDASGQREGHIDASSFTLTGANGSTSTISGDISYAYARNGNQIVPSSLMGSLSSYQSNVLDASPESVYGNTRMRIDGKLDLFPSFTEDSNGLHESYLTGGLSQLTFNASKLLKSEVIKGDLQVTPSKVATDPVSANSNPLSTQAEAINVAIAGSVSSYDANYYDGSHIRLSGGTPVPASRETSLIKALSQADLWSGNDKVSIILPNSMEQSVNVNTGDGNDTVTAKGGGGELTIDTGAGDDQITLLDDQIHLTTGEGLDTLRADFSYVSMSDYSGLENVVFTGKQAVEITGNQLDNQITGGNFDDQIRGEQGNDVLQGLGGTDNLSGGNGDDQLFGGAGNDTLTGGAGADTLWGGAGHDLYVVENDSDIVNESRSPTNTGDAGGIDTVWSLINQYTLGARVENLVLNGQAISGQGNALANIITGNDGDNTLSGEGGNDTLYGQSGNDRLDGGAGIDTLWGGSGDDTYVIDNARDRISEALHARDDRDAGGNDTVESSISFTLAQGFENLVLTGKSNLNGTGNDADNHLNGNDGNNIIDGKAGTDSLNGGEGSDIYLIGSSDEHRAAEFADNGVGSNDVDEVRFAPKPATVTVGEPMATPKLTLFAGDTGIERVVIGTGTGKLAVSSGKMAADIDASKVTHGLTIAGNAGVNELIGTSFNDTLIGNGGFDTLVGGKGSDKFVFNMTPNAKTDVDTLSDFSHGEDQLVFVRS